MTTDNLPVEIGEETVLYILQRDGKAIDYLFDKNIAEQGRAQYPGSTIKEVNYMLWLKNKI